MKRFFSLFLTFIIVFSCVCHASAAGFFVFAETDAPVITQQCSCGTAPGLTLEFSHEPGEKAVAAEEQRQTVYAAVSGLFTAEDIKTAGYEYLSYPVCIFAECEINGTRFTAGQYGCADEKLTFSLVDDILIPFTNAGGDRSCLKNGTTAEIVFLYASGNFADGEERLYAQSAVSEVFSFEIPPLGFAEYNLPEGVNNNPNPLFFSLPLTREIPLENISLDGFVFNGWLSEGDGADSIPAGAEKAVFTPVFIPKQYAVNYFLATDITYPFGRADNRKNPSSYTAGEGAEIYDIASPVFGYVFDGWYPDASFSGEKVTLIPPESRGDIILYAKWITEEEAEERADIERSRLLLENGFCDPDCDGKVTAADARLTLRAAVGLETTTGEMLRRADLFGAGKLSSEDARQILRAAVGLVSLAQIEKMIDRYDGG